MFRSFKSCAGVLALTAMLVGVPVAFVSPTGATGTNCPPPIGSVFNNQFVSQTFTFTLASGSWDAGDQLTIAGSGATNLSISVNGTVVASSSVAPLVYMFPSAVPAPALTTLTLTLAGAPNEATISCVHINVGGLLNDLAGEVSGVGPGKSLSDKVAQAAAYFAANNVSSTCSTLQDFLNEVQAQTGKKITAAVAASLTGGAQNIRTALAC